MTGSLLRNEGERKEKGNGRGKKADGWKEETGKKEV